jgi:hypothetical protein
MGETCLTAIIDDPSFNALRLAIASQYNEQARERWQTKVLDENLDWPSLGRLATMHGLGPLLHEATKSIDAPSASDEALAELKREYQLTAAHNMLAEHDLKRMLGALNAAGVQVAVLKGTALLNMVYRDPALRPMVDIDLLIRFADRTAALEALGRAGYAPTEPEPFENLNGLYWNERVLCDQSRTSTQLELHWNLLDIPYYASRLSTAQLLKRAQPMNFGDVQGLSLAIDDTLLYLCAHNTFHHQGLLWRNDVDVAFFVSRHQAQLDWETLITRATDLDLVLGLQQSILKAEQLWLAPVPVPVLEQLGTLEPRTREKVMVACQRSEFLKLLRTLLTLPSLEHRVHFVNGQLFPSRDYLYWRYGVAATVPGPVAFSRRYWSGLHGVLSEIFSRSNSG